MNNVKLTIEEFRYYKEQLKYLIDDVRNLKNDIFKNNILTMYYGLQDSLLSYDLSDIPSSEWEGIKILSDKDHIVDFSSTNANIDLSIFDNLKYVNLSNCNIKSDDIREKIITGTSKIKIEDYPLKIISQNEDLFLIGTDIPEKIKKNFFDRILSVENFIEYQDDFNKFPIDNFLTPELEISDKIKENYPLGEYQKIILKYQEFFKKISHMGEMFFFNSLLITEENLDKTIFKAAKKFIFSHSLNSFDVSEWIQSLNLNIVNDVTTMEDFFKYDINSFSLNKKTEEILEYFDIDYLKRFEEETQIFSNSNFEIFKLLKDYVSEKGLYSQKPLENYEDFEKTFISYLEKMRKANIYENKLDYNSLTIKLTKKYPKMFIDINAPEELKELFNKGKLTIETIISNPEYFSYLENKDLFQILSGLDEFYLVNKSITKVDNYINEYIKNYGNKEFLKLCLDYGIFLPKNLIVNSIEDFKDKNKIDKIIKESIYKRIIGEEFIYNAFNYKELEKNENFIHDYPDIFVDFKMLNKNDNNYLKSLCYEGILTSEHIKKYPILKEILKDKKIEVFFRANKDSYHLIQKIGNLKFLELSENYGRYLEAISEDDIEKINKDDNIDKNIQKIIIEKCLIGKFYYNEESPLFLKEQSPRLFLDEDAPKKLKEYFYSNEKYLDFEILKENYKEWKKYLDNEKIKLALIKNPGINNIMLKYFEEFGLEKAIKLGLKNPKVVMSMINNADIYDMKIWYEKTGETFIPNRTVMKEFPKKDIDKFLLSGKSWSILMRLDSYSTSPEKIKSLIKASYLFGVFDQDKTGFDNLYHILTNIPKKISVDYESILEEVKKSINNENRKVLEDSLKEENIEVNNDNLFDYFYKYDEKSKNYKLNINTDYCPKTSKIFRNILEKYDELPILTPDKLERIFKDFDYTNNQKFRQFFLKNLDSILTNPDYIELLSKVLINYSEIEKANSNRKLTLNSTYSYISSDRYKNINPGNEKLAKISLIAGYQDKEFEILQQIYNVGRKRTFSSIPRIENNKDNYHYEILRLDDPLALGIGILNNCCQKLGDLAEACMEHSMVDNNGRIFVVKDKTGNLVAQSWVWRNKDTLCFDNIEMPANAIKRNLESSDKKDLAKEIFEIYQQAAKELMKIDEETYKELLISKKITKEEYDGLRLKKITVGQGHNDIDGILKNNLELIDEKSIIRPIEYDSLIVDKNLYVKDSDIQYVLEDTKEDSNYNGDNLYLYNDKYIEYTDSNFTDFNTYQELEKITKNINYKNTDNNHFITDLAYKHNLNPKTARIVMNPNFAILYDSDEEKIRIADLLFNTKIVNKEQVIDIEDSVKLQINLALKQISKDKKIELLDIDEKQKNMYEESIALNTNGKTK